jgi:hypothetical protein
MSTDPTKQPPIEPTVPASHDPYTPALPLQNPYETTGPYQQGSIPLPPPPPRQKHTGLIITLIGVSCLSLVLGGILFATLYTRGTQPPGRTRTFGSTPRVTPNLQVTLTPQITPTSHINTNYIAIDIVHHMMMYDKSLSIYDQNESIWQFSHDNYYVTVHAMSSVQFTGCPYETVGQCADTWYFGIWVYADSNSAFSAWQQVESDSLSCNDTSPASDGMHVSCGQDESAYTHGRCLLLNSNDQSTYGEAITQYCI